MNYLKIYNNIIENRKINKPNGYTEIHHILPRCLGGSNSKENLVILTGREHYIAHLLLTKFFKEETIEWYKMVNAFMYMNCKSILNNKRYINSRLYERLKEKISKLMSFLNTGNKNFNYNKIWINNKILKISKMISKKEVSYYLINGWDIGRIINWDSYRKQKLYQLIQIFNKKIKQYNKNIHKSKNECNKLKYRIDKNKELYNFYYQEYNKLGWVYFKKKYNYTKTQQNFVAQLKRYVKDFKPQNSKKRGDKNIRYNPYKNK